MVSIVKYINEDAAYEDAVKYGQATPEEREKMNEETRREAYDTKNRVLKRMFGKTYSPSPYTTQKEHDEELMKNPHHNFKPGWDKFSTEKEKQDAGMLTKPIKKMIDATRQ